MNNTNETTTGNAAKLREALSKFCAYSAVVLNTGMFNRVHLEALLNIAKAALAAPPRNCDRFATGDLERDAQDAMEAMLDEGVAGYRSMAQYLLSPVHKEKNGENDGSK